MSRSRILVAVSSPWASEKFVQPMLDLARRLDAEVLIAHVAQQQDQDETDSDARQRGEETVRLLTDALKAEGLTADGVMLFSNDAAKALLNTAQSRHCSLIVVGLTGRGLLKRLFHGDVPGNLIRQAEIPVLVCPSGWAGVL